MKVFASFVNTLDSTNKTSQKLKAIELFLNEADEQDKLWLVALFTGKRPKRAIRSGLMKQWAVDLANIPEWLFVESYAVVGDLSETISLILPEPEFYEERSLSDWMALIQKLPEKTEEEKKQFVLHSWNHLPAKERFIFNKLIGGSFRLGVSTQLLINALAKHFEMEPSAVTHSIMGEWQPDGTAFDKLIKGEYVNIQSSKPYPFCLAYALDKPLEDLGAVTDWEAEYKWDGIRGQFIKRDGEVFIWSRGEELISDQFPEIAGAMKLPLDDYVLDGEILIVKNAGILNFSELQKRINRKNVTKKMTDELPACVFAYDLLEWNGEDLRGQPLAFRRSKLETLLNRMPADRFRRSEAVVTDTWDTLKKIQENARNLNAEGLMLKHKASPYHTGRKRGDWWKWKIDPLTIDAVLIYAQKGSGRRSSYYTDYTFAVKDGEQLVTIAKAYSGLTDQEIQEVSRFVTRNAVEKFGPVRTVKAELVFEIAFEGISLSSRHKAGVALRFPRIARWRKDKTVADIDTLENVRKLIR